MTQITAGLPDEIVSSLDAAALRLRRSRAEVVRQAIENYPTKGQWFCFT
jgi:predicted transcriptional regulator